jgi:peroxiredoxin
MILSTALFGWAECSRAADPAKSSGASKSETAELYKLPSTNDVDALFEYVKRVAEFEPGSQAELTEHRNKGLSAVRAALEKILSLERDPKSANATRARMMLLGFRVASVEQAPVAEQRKLVEEIRRLLTLEASADNARLAMELATNLEFGDQIELAGEAYEAFSKALAKSNPDSPLSKRMAGAARRLGLVGKPLELHAVDIDGRPFDWSKYRGKVVLVDFWATWCAPCRKELPNIRANYAKYYPRGFEVVGVSQDDDMPALKEFLNEEKFPWVTLLDHADKPNQPSPSEYYGIFGIPCTFLVDREGKVVSLKARGADLGKQLEKLCEPAGK